MQRTRPEHALALYHACWKRFARETVKMIQFLPLDSVTEQEFELPFVRFAASLSERLPHGL